MENLPPYVSPVFVLTVAVAIWLFAYAARYSRVFVIGVLSWIGVQSWLGLSDFYKAVDPVPPRFPLLLIPPVVVIILLFVTAKGRTFLAGLNLRTLRSCLS